MKKILAGKIRHVVESTDKKYVEILNPQISMMTERAVCINKHWVPLSQLAIDVDDNLYMKKWLYEKEFAG